MVEQVEMNQECELEPPFPALSIQSKILLSRCIYALDHFRALANDLPLQAACIIILVAKQPGITVRELMARSKLSQSSCSRNIALLSETNRHGRPGLNVIEARPDPTDSRRYTLYLTPKGEEFAALLKDIFR